MTLQQKINLSHNIIEKAFHDNPRTFMSFSGGKDSTVLLDLVRQVKPDVKIIGIDTGFEFPETITFTDGLMKKHGIEIEYLKPTFDQRLEVFTKHGMSGPDNAFMTVDAQSGETKRTEPTEKNMVDGQWMCCAMKEPALRNFLERGEHDAWLTGLRADETEARKYVGIYQQGKGDLLKVNPIIFWEVNDIWQYIEEKKLEVHAKYSEGYKSLGCKPCTEAGFREGKGNQSKFEDMGVSGERDECSECGLHV